MIDTGSQIGNRVQSRPSLFALLAEPDEWSRYAAAHARAGAALGVAAQAPPIPDIDVMAEVHRALLEGTDLPENFAARNAEAIRLADARGAERNAISRAQSSFATELGHLADESVPEMFEALDRTVRDSVAAAAELLAAMPDVTDPLAAIRSGHVDEWRELAELHETYATAQEDAHFLRRVDNPEAVTKGHGHFLFRRLSVAWPDWYRSELGQRQPGWTEWKTAPWPADTTGLEHFLWVVAHREAIEPWAPTVAQAHEARETERRREPEHLPTMKPGGEAIRDAGGEAAFIHRRTGRAPGVLPAPGQGSVVWHGFDRPGA